MITIYQNLKLFSYIDVKVRVLCHKLYFLLLFIFVSLLYTLFMVQSTDRMYKGWCIPSPSFQAVILIASLQTLLLIPCTCCCTCWLCGAWFILSPSLQAVLKLVYCRYRSRHTLHVRRAGARVLRVSPETPVPKLRGGD